MNDIYFKSKIKSHLTTDCFAHFFELAVAMKLAVVKKPWDTVWVLEDGFGTLFFEDVGHSTVLFEVNSVSSASRVQETKGNAEHKHGVEHHCKI